MHFHTVKMYKDKEVKNNVKDIFFLTWYRHFKRNGGLNQILKRQTSRSHYGSKVTAVTIFTVVTTQ
jgi:hypothetical protein